MVTGSNRVDARRDHDAVVAVIAASSVVYGLGIVSVEDRPIIAAVRFREEFLANRANPVDVQEFSFFSHKFKLPSLLKQMTFVTCYRISR
jgi:hypothetical protein